MNYQNMEVHSNWLVTILWIQSWLGKVVLITIIVTLLSVFKAWWIQFLIQTISFEGTVIFATDVHVKRLSLRENEIARCHKGGSVNILEL